MQNLLPTDEQLAIRLKNGDAQAITLIYERFKTGLFHFVHRLLLDTDAAEDVVHETFVTIISERLKIQNPASLKSWIYSIARNEAFTVLRRKRKLRTINDDESIFVEESPLSIIEMNERTLLIETLLNQLLPQYKEVLMLREFESMSYDEIASITDSSVSSVKSKLFRARKELMEKAKPYMRESAV